MTQRHDAGICSIEDCANSTWSRGWCRKHYARWHTHGDPEITKIRHTPAGEPLKFLNKALTYDGNECLFWPYATNSAGYAQIVHPELGKKLVHRIVCERTNGAPLSRRHQALHECGMGHMGCIAPRHLRWGTQKENSADMVQHGRSSRGKSMAKVPLSKDQAIEIFRRANRGENQSALAEEFGIAQTAVSKIKLGKTWGWLTASTIADMIGVETKQLKQEQAA